MSKVNTLSCRGVGYFKLILLLIFLILILGTIGIVTGIRLPFFKSSNFPETSRAIKHTTVVITKNRPTQDKKFIWIEAQTHWEVMYVKKTSVFTEQARLIDYIDKYVSYRTKAAIIRVVQGNSSTDILNKRGQLENQVRNMVESDVTEYFKDKYDISIQSIKFDRIKSFAKPYEGEDLPPYDKP